MFNIFKKKEKNKNDYSLWVNKEIELAKEAGINLSEHVTSNTHPLHAKQIRIALCDELSPNQIEQIKNTVYKNEEELIDMRNLYLTLPDFEYIKEYYPELELDDNKLYCVTYSEDCPFYN